MVLGVQQISLCGQMEDLSVLELFNLQEIAGLPCKDVQGGVSAAEQNVAVHFPSCFDILCY